MSVLDGEVSARLPDGSRQRVSGGTRLTVQGDRIDTGELSDDELRALRDLRGRALTIG